MGKLFIFLIILMLYSCANDGDYRYIITKSDGTTVRVYNVQVKEGCVMIYPPYNCGEWYYMNSTEYKEIHTIKLTNINKKDNKLKRTIKK